TGFSEQMDTESTFNGAQFQPLVEGYYLIGGTISMPSNGGTTGIAIRLNGSNTNHMSVQYGGGIVTTAQHAISAPVRLTGTDYAELAGYCDYSPAPAFNSSIFWACRIGPQF